MDPDEQDQTDLEKAQRDRLARDTAVDRDVMSAPRIPKAEQPIYEAPETAGPARRALTATAGDDAEREGVINRLSLLTGQPPAALRTLDAARIAEMVREQGVLTNTEDTPTLRGRYADDDFARVAGDDVSALAEIERQMLAARQIEQPGPAPKPKPQGDAGALAGFTPESMAQRGEALEGQAGRMLSGVGNAGRAMAAGPIDATGKFFGDTVRIGAELADDFMRSPDSVVLARVFGNASDEEIRAMSPDAKPKDPDALLPRAAAWGKSVSEASKALGDAIAPTPTGDFVGDAFMQGFRSAGASLTWLGLGVLTGNPGAAVGGMAGMSGAASAGEGLDKGLDPLNATLFGLAHGGAEFAGERLPFMMLLGDITNKTPFGEMFVKNLLTEQATETATTITQQGIDYLALHPDATFGDYVNSLPPALAQTWIATLAGTVGQMGVVGGIQEVQKAVESGQIDAAREKAISEGGLKALGAMVAAATDSKTRERDPSQFEAYVETLAQDAPIRAAYIKPDTFAAIAASEAVSPEQLAVEFGVEGQVAASLASGATIELPLARFLSVVAGKEASREAYMRGVAWSPFTLSQDEIDLQPSKQMAALIADAEKLAQRIAAGDVLPGGPEVFAAQVDTIRQTIEKDLRGTGRVNLQQAFPAYARLTAAAYGTLALRLGKTPEEVFASEGLRIDSELSGVAHVDQEGSRGPLNGMTNGREDVFRILDADPNTRIEALADQTGLSGGQASRLRAEWKRERGVPTNQRKEGRSGVTPDYYAQAGFEPIAESAANDLETADPAEWASIVKATKYAAYKIPEGQEDVQLPKGYVLAWHTTGAYAISEKHMREREKAGQATFERIQQEGQRGAYAPSTNTISLLAKADFSTFLHELGHHWLEVYMRAATDIRDRAKAGETVTPGEQEVLDDMKRWLDIAGVDQRYVGTQPGGSSVASMDIMWGLNFFDNLLVDATEEQIKELRLKLAREGRAPVVKLFKTTNGRIMAFPGGPEDYSHADARNLLAVNDKPGAEFKMRHATYDGGALRSQNWYDTSGVLDDDGSFAQLDANSFKVLKTSTPQERLDWYAEHVVEEAGPRGGRRLRLKSNDALNYPDVDILLKPVDRDGFQGFTADMLFNGNLTKPRNPDAKPDDPYATPEDVLTVKRVFTRTMLALKVWADRTQPDFISFIASPAQHDGRLKMYDAILRRYDFGYEARITSTIDVVATPGETTAGESKLFVLVRPDVAPEMPLELSNARIDLDDEFMGEPAATKRRAITHIVNPGRPNQLEPDRDGGRADNRGGRSGSYSQSQRRAPVELSDDRLDRASKELNEKQFEAFKLAATGMSNEEIAVSMGGENADVSLDDVSRYLAQARKYGYTTEKAPKAVLSPETMRVIALSARGAGPKAIAETVYGTADKAGQVRVLRNRHKSLIEQFARQRAGSLAQGPVFYSALKRAVQSSKQAKAPAADWKAILRKAEGVKQEEIETVGLFDYLDLLAEQGQKQIVREDIVAFLDANGVQIADVLLGPPVEKPKTEDPVVGDTTDADRAPADAAEYERLRIRHMPAIDEAVEDALKDAFAEEAAVFFESYTPAMRLLEPVLESEIETVEEDWREGYYGSGLYDPPFHVFEEDAASFEGEEGEDPPKVWVIRNAHYENHRQNHYGMFDDERSAQNAADDLNNTDESEAATDYLDSNHSAIRTEALTGIIENLPEYDFYDRVFAMWRDRVGDRNDIELEATRSVFVGLGEAALFDRINSSNLNIPRANRPTYSPTKWDSYTLVKGEQYRELLLTLASHKGKPFEHSGHWGANQNMLAHVRFSIVDGVVVIEEIQSDWHQKGREQGYKTPIPPAVVLAPKDITVEQREHDWMVTAPDGRYFGLGRGTEGTEQGAREYAARFFNEYAARFFNERAQRKHRDAEIAQDLKVPDAPMKETTSWGALVLKRMVRWAAENGYNEIAWTPGDVQAERWSMARVVDELVLVPRATDWLLVGYKNGLSVVNKPLATRNEVAEYIGKEALTKLLDSPPANHTAGWNAAHILAVDENTMVGPGKGMRFFYDTALVNEANRLLKKHGGKVDQKVLEHPGKARKPGAGGVRDRVITVDGEPFTVTGEATAYHRMVIPESLKAAALEGLPLFQPEQGATPPPGGPSRSQLPPDADALDVWNAMSLNEKTRFHELFARQTEAYFFEGKAPSNGLRKMFRDFARWLTKTYEEFGGLASLNAPLTDEVRAIMDRVYASSQDIAEANRVNALTPLFATKPPDMGEPEWQQYQADIADATMEAEETLRTRSLRDMKWLGNARTRELKRIQAEAKEVRAVVYAQIKTQVMAEPVNVARLFLKQGENPDGSAVEGAVPYFKDGQLLTGKPKLSIAALKTMYPEGSGVDFTTLGYGKWGMLSAEGTHPDVLAPLLGYPSGDALVRDLMAAPPAKQKIDDLTDTAMLERYGDLTDDKAAARAADEAVHEGLRGRVLAAEYAALTAMLGQRKLMGEAAKAAAEQLVARMNSSKLSPAKFIAAERRAGRDADQAMRQGKTIEAAAAKRDQLLNFHIVREIHAQQATRDKAVAMFYKIAQAKKEAVAKTRNYDLVQASRAVLASVGFAQMRNKPIEYLNAVKAYDPQLYASLEPQLLQITTAGLKIKDLTVEQFLSLRDTVRQLWDLSREEMLIEINGEKVEKAAVTLDLNTRMEQLGADPNKPILEAPSTWQRRLRGLEGVAASLRRVEQWARLVDGLRVGPFTKYFFRPVNAAATQYRLALADYLTRYRALFAPIEAKLSQDKIAAPELNGYTFQGKSELLHALLHTGNLSNKTKLLLGYGWATEDANGLLDTTRWDAFVQRMVAEGKITVEDYQFAQGVWDLLEQTKPLAQAAHRRVFGRYFAEVTANPVMTPFGEFRGGYVPAVYDDYHEPSVTEYKRMDAIEANDSQMFPAPGKGFTESRVKYNKPMHLDLRLLSGHIDKVLKFAHMAAPVRDVVRLLRTESVRRNLFDIHPTALSDLLTPWLMRAARQTTDAPMEGKAGSMVNRWAAVLRRRANMGLMLGNLVNVMQQPTGLFNAMAYKGVQKRHFAPALIRLLSDVRGVTESVHAASPYMQSRALHQAIAMRDAVDDIADPKGAMQKAEQFFARHTYFMQIALQNPQDTVVWLASYESAKERGDTEADAALFADGVIRATQGESTPDSISRAETGDALSKILLSMYSYFNMWGNHLSTEFRGAVQEMGLRKSLPRLVYVYSIGFMIPAVLAALIAGLVRGTTPDEDEEDDIALAWLAWFFGAQGSTGAAMVPYVGPAVMAGLNTFNNKPYDDRVLSSPAISALEAAAGSVRNVWDYATGEGDLSNTLKDTFTALTLMTGLPFQALNRPLGYAADVIEGDTEPEDGVDAVRGAIAGR